MAKLQFLTGDLLGRELELANGEHRVGRAADNTIVIEDASVSRRHCLLLVHGREVIARELGSHNGTWVNGQKVTGQRAVEARQIVRFGQVEARLILGPEDRLSDTTTLSATHGFVRFLKREAADKVNPAAPVMPVGKTAEPETKVVANVPVPPMQPSAIIPLAPPAKRTSSLRLIIWTTSILALLVLLKWLLSGR